MRNCVVIGGYGLIGEQCCRALLEAGFTVHGIGRSREAAQATGLPIQWSFHDIAKAEIEELKRDLADAEIVVNCAGALQDGLRDNLEGVHVHAVEKLIAALAGRHVRFIQMSASGVSEDADTEFLRSKARGDEKIKASGLEWIILRPTMVIGPVAYGGTALLRALAAVPGVRFSVYPDVPVQTVWVEDVAHAVVASAQGRIVSGTVADLTERDRRSFDETVADIRRWLGKPEWKWRFRLPIWLVTVASRGADSLGWLGWRSPLRSNALRALRNGVTGDPDSWERAGGSPCRNLACTLLRIPATPQERWFAHLYLLLPMAIAVLAVFWISTGVVALFRFSDAVAVLTSRDVPRTLSMAIVAGGSIADLFLGGGLLVRKWAARAAMGMAAVSGAYVVGSVLAAPDLWLDPIGPMIKVFPSIPLALMVAAMLGER